LKCAIDNNFLRNVVDINCKNTLKKCLSNCIGTALYLVGEQPTDSYIFNYDNKGEVDIRDHNVFVRSLVESLEPIPGSLVAWVRNVREVYHLGVVVNRYPVLVAHRDRYGGDFHSSQPLEEVMVEHGGNNQGESIKYFLPSKLIKILEKSE